MFILHFFLCDHGWAESVEVRRSASHWDTIIDGENVAREIKNICSSASRSNLVLESCGQRRLQLYKRTIIYNQSIASGITHFGMRLLHCVHHGAALYSVESVFTRRPSVNILEYRTRCMSTRACTACRKLVARGVAHRRSNGDLCHPAACTQRGIRKVQHPSIHHYTFDHVHQTAALIVYCALRGSVTDRALLDLVV